MSVPAPAVARTAVNRLNGRPVEANAFRLAAHDRKAPTEKNTVSRRNWVCSDHELNLMNILQLQPRINRQNLDDVLTQRGLSHTFSLARYRLRRYISRSISQYAGGACLDAGCGRSPYRSMLADRASSVVSLDVEDRGGGADLIGDVQKLTEIEDASFETVFCSQVLEHVPRPWEAISEFARVLRPGGRLILTVPHLSVIHEAPHDYYRYTRYGLNALCEAAGLQIEKVEPTGGLISFLSHGCSWALMCTAGSLPLLRWPVWLLNYIFLVRALDLVDRVLGMASRYPCDQMLVACKSPNGG